MNTIECPAGYHCEIYPAWGAHEYLAFFGGIGAVILLAILVAVLAFRWLDR